MASLSKLVNSSRRSLTKGSDIKDLVSTLKEIDADFSHTATISVGILGKDASKPHPNGGTVGDIAVIHEFGSDNGDIPERSFLRKAINYNEENMALINSALQNIPLGATNSEREEAYKKLGDVMTGMVLNCMLSEGYGQWPKIVEATAKSKRGGKARGSGHPLIDTGTLMNSIDSEVIIND